MSPVPSTAVLAPVGLPHSVRDWALLGGGVVLLLAVSAVLALTEVGLSRLNHLRALALEGEGRKGAKRLARLLERPDRTLNPVLLLTVAVHLLIGVVVGSVLGPLGVLVVLGGWLVALVVVFVVAESAPKTLAIGHADRVGLGIGGLVGSIASVWPLQMLTRLLVFLSNLLIPGRGSPTPTASEEDLLHVAGRAAETRAIEKNEEQYIQQVIEFGDTIVREVMVARPDMISIAAPTRIADVLDVALTVGYSRLPVYEEGTDDVIGMVFLRDLVEADRGDRGDEPVRSIARPARFVPELKRVAELLPEMQKGRYHMAVVVDEYGGIAGLVTLEDLLEELVGEITDEYDREGSPVIYSSDRVAVVKGAMAIDDANDLFGLHLDEDADWDTVAGYLMHRLRRVPDDGDSVNDPDALYVVTRMAGNRIEQVRITTVAPFPSSGDEMGEAKVVHAAARALSSEEAGQSSC